MNHITSIIIYLGFLALIGFSVWHTTSVLPLILILLAPTIHISSTNDADHEQEEEEQDEKNN